MLHDCCSVDDMIMASLVKKKGFLTKEKKIGSCVFLCACVCCDVFTEKYHESCKNQIFVGTITEKNIFNEGLI